MTKIKITLLFVSLFICLVLIDDIYAGTDAAAFLKKSVGSKAIAMGGAFTSIADDTTAIYWNPAGLAKSQMYSVSAMDATGVSDKYPGLKDIVPTHPFLAMAVALEKFTNVLGKTVVGVGYISSTMDNVQHTSSDGQTRDTMSHTDNAYYLSAGVPIWDSDSSLYVGGSLKFISYEFSDIGVSDSGIDLDAGIIYAIDTLSFGVVIQKGVEIGEDKAPMTTKFGVSNRFMLAEKLQLTGALDLVQRQQEPLLANIGAEFGIKELLNMDGFGIDGIFLRAGVEGYAIENRYDISSDLNETVGYNFGLGANFIISNTYLKLDLAICSGNIFDQNTKFTINFYF
ncbi:MAG: hypothetical protein PHG84_07290 [Endomicrobiaceae bacterium]|nr:hypothetical protein [Endomicrobiaceae bacterium]